ncbi:RNA polymerase sigma factor RpoD [Candidatus Phytoplasma meliae]|uniref:RNA polymerase sigma factor SigA n=1 Tax=Candidatus Phytoplasma meliae TaxID=1848402 RepID=A0ABS5CYS9_9MOLU|nr:RNA polymerase sigma factor RpoD [Candidatus Phytoplasma meliae]MBP5836130.1 RNA polymerase sigma factor RpoD [Candidatus Phytoplasma meliae]
MNLNDIVKTLNNKAGVAKKINFEDVKMLLTQENFKISYQQIEKKLKEQGIKITPPLSSVLNHSSNMDHNSNIKLTQTSQLQSQVEDEMLADADFQKSTSALSEETPQEENKDDKLIDDLAENPQNEGLESEPNLEDLNLTLDDNDDQLIKEDVTKVAADIKMDDSVRMYLKEIGCIPLLSLEEERKRTIEVFLGKQAKQKLDKARMQEISLSEQEIQDLENQIKQAQYAKDILVESNYRLVVSVAKRYIGRGVLFLDLIQEGNMGLMRAVDNFDYQKGFRFSTYAFWWMYQGITRAIADQARTIRIPVHIVENINKIALCTRKLTQQLKKKPTVEEIAMKMNVSVDKIRSIQHIEKKPISLESPARENEDETSLGDFISDPNILSPHEYMMKEVTQKLLNEVLENTLTDREEQIIKMRYGLLDGKNHTLEEVGNLFGVTRERIRQIESKALRRLRAPAKQSKLKSLYHNYK